MLGYSLLGVLIVICTVYAIRYLGKWIILYNCGWWQKVNTCAICGFVATWPFLTKHSPCKKCGSMKRLPERVMRWSWGTWKEKRQEGKKCQN